MEANEAGTQRYRHADHHKDLRHASTRQATDCCVTGDVTPLPKRGGRLSLRLIRVGADDIFCDGNLVAWQPLRRGMAARGCLILDSTAGVVCQWSHV